MQYKGVNTTKVIIDDFRYNEKPTDYGYIENRLKKANATEVTLAELVTAIENGQTIRPCIITGDKFEQQVFFVDIDNKSTSKVEQLTPSSVAELCKKYEFNINIIYNSFNNSIDIPKFRVVFILDKPINDKATAEKIQATLIRLLNGDKQTTNVNRYYFGTNKGICRTSDTRTTADAILKHYIEPENKPKRCTTELSYNIIPSNIFEPKTVINFAEFIEYVTRLDMFKILNIAGIPKKAFKCILHEDNTASASIIINSDGQYFYQCFAGCTYKGNIKQFNIIGIWELLLNFTSRYKTIKSLCEYLNITIAKDEWQTEQIQMLTDNIRAINTRELADNCPTAWTQIKRDKDLLLELLEYAKDNVLPKEYSINNKLIFFVSGGQLARTLNKSQQLISRKTSILSYHLVIEKLPDNQINEKLLNRAKELKGIYNNKRITFYSISNFTYNTYPSIEQQGINWGKNNYTRVNFSREMLYRAEGQTIADRVYPQFEWITENGEVKARTTTAKNDKITIEIEQFILHTIEKKGYCTEKDILNNTNYKNKVNSQLKKTLADTINKYELIRCRANKELKIRFNIVVNSNSYPFILYRE